MSTKGYRLRAPADRGDSASAEAQREFWEKMVLYARREEGECDPMSDTEQRCWEIGTVALCMVDAWAKIRDYREDREKVLTAHDRN